MKTCSHSNCMNPVWGKGFCKNHQWRRSDFDKRNSAQKYADKVKSGNVDKAKIRESKVNDEIDESLQNLIEDADAIFSKYIRLKYSDSNGIVDCFTCDNRLPIAQIQNGHFVSRANLGLRFMEDNCRPQCPQCNQKHEEDTLPFSIGLEAEKTGITAFLEEEARLVAKPTRSELKGIIAHYRERVKILETKLQKP